MCLDVFLEMVFTTESLTTDVTGKGTETRVDALVTSELFVARECLAAVVLVTREWSLACKTNQWDELQRFECFRFKTRTSS